MAYVDRTYTRRKSSLNKNIVCWYYSGLTTQTVASGINRRGKQRNLSAHNLYSHASRGFNELANRSGVS